MAKRIKRDAFLYLEGKKADFAQCSSCCLFDDGKCTIFGTKVKGTDSCGLYIPGWYAGISNAKRVTPEEAGYVQAQVRCENCRYGGDTCKLYEQLNKLMPYTFDLDIKIKPKACCNAWRKK